MTSVPSIRTLASVLDAGLSWVLHVHDGETPTLFPLPAGGSLLVGRSEECAVRVDDPTLSRRHARLIVDDEGVCVEDLDSLNGTRVDGVPLAPAERRRLLATSTLTFGVVEARLRRLSTTRMRRIDPGRETDPDRPFSLAVGWPDGPVVVEPAMIELFGRVARIAEHALNVLVVGETGAGKEIVAEAVHRCSPRSAETFLALNCAGLPESMVESELFGYERGAFTGAVASKPGLIEAAHRGTLFLDEVGELSAGMQAKLLRALEKGEVRRLGSVQSRHVDVRFVSATNRDLAAMVEEGTFRRDLYFRLGGYVVRVPPLRERPRDIVALARHFLALASARARRAAPELSPDAIAALRAHAWPGNVRELRSVMERALAIARGGEVRAEHLDDGEGRSFARGELPPATPPLGASLRARIAAEERECILEALRRCDGNQVRTARALGISRRGLINKLDALGIERPRKGKGG